MKNIQYVPYLVMILLFLPAVIFAHGLDTETNDQQNDGLRSMERIEDRILGDDLHEELEELMTKMMSGTLTDEEIDRLAELTRQYPGPQAMMMGRFMGMGIGPSGSLFSSFNQNTMMGLYGIGGFWGGLLMILFWVLVIIGIIALIKYALRANEESRSSKSALDILKERYARGEMDKSEYEEKKRDLQE
jgi:putative membrane protein